MTTVALRAKLLLGSSLVAALAIASTDAVAQNRGGRRDLDTTLAFARTGVVIVGGGSATIVVTGWDQNTVRITARSEDGPFRLEATSSRVMIEPSRSNDDATIQVMVPRGVRVVVATNSGDITVKETRGPVDAETGSGDILIVDAIDVEATNLSGELDVRQASGTTSVSTNNGDCTVSDSKGTIEASSVSGDIRLARVAAKIVRASTTNGDIGFEGTIDAEGRYEFVSHSGDVELELPKTASALIGVTTWSGTVDSEFGITLRPGFTTASTGTTKRYTFTLGAGSARITAETFSGDISIISRGVR